MKRARTGALATLWGPAVILPSQQTAVPFRTPEVRLVAAILEDAFQSVAHNFEARGKAGREFLKAYRWFFDDRLDWPFAFRNVCDLLRLDAAAVRQRVRRIHATGSAKLQPSPAPERE